jgi:hypothetical protein
MGPKGATNLISRAGHSCARRAPQAAIIPASDRPAIFVQLFKPKSSSHFSF